MARPSNLQVPTASIDRSAGDLHGNGNPHYLLDPLCGLEVAGLLRDRMAADRALIQPLIDEGRIARM